MGPRAVIGHFFRDGRQSICEIVIHAWVSPNGVGQMAKHLHHVLILRDSHGLLVGHGRPPEEEKPGTLKGLGRHRALCTRQRAKYAPQHEGNSFRPAIVP
jgi:hypothetical protein